ncbi:ABC transporter ATP-binding protein [Ensifer adhaerens]|uniref:ABC transporter ATP-binding protein n=1 Tax=Ensifer TaxID=106591 RepID=UPI001785F6F5|nr:ABC transporter ATP-binding protein [Ensifer sp. ENS08]MBD9570789.1 ABC transporter ATP-binding protein [Ensifer sp. ENS08]
MTELLLKTEGLVKRFGGLVATDNLSLEVAEGELHAIIGPNGAGKTTLISQLAGEVPPTGGRILFQGRDITRMSTPQRCRQGLVRSFQITSLCKDMTALQNVALAVQARQGHSFRPWRSASDDSSLVEPARALLQLVGLLRRGDNLAGELAHGEQRQLELAVALATEPKLILLDEPMAGMGQEESAAMVQLLSRIKSRYTIVLIEHDMEAVFALADRISVLVYGRCLATGTPAEIRSNPDVQKAYLGEEGPHA